MKVAVCIPWRPEPSRLAAFERVMKFWRGSGPLPPYRVVCADSNPNQPFSRSEARNNAVKDAGADVVIIADGDTIGQHDVIEMAVKRAAEGNEVVYPYTRYRAMRAEDVDAPRLNARTPLFTKYNAAGGIFAVATQLFWSLGGYDELFEPRWGHQDGALLVVAETLAKVTRLNGVVWSFDHAVERDASEDNPNWQRYELYRFAKGKPGVMRELLKR